MFDFNTENILAGLQVTLYGLCGVFLVLILFYFLTKLMMVLAKKFSSKDS